MTNPFHSWNQHSEPFHSKHRVTHHRLDSKTRQNVKCSLILKDVSETGKNLKCIWQQRNLAKVQKRIREEKEVWENLTKTDSVVSVGWSASHHRRMQPLYTTFKATVGSTDATLMTIILVSIYLFYFFISEVVVLLKQVLSRFPDLSIRSSDVS